MRAIETSIGTVNVFTAEDVGTPRAMQPEEWVCARSLHEFLGSSKQFGNFIKAYTKGLEEGREYLRYEVVFNQLVKNPPAGGRPKTEYAVTTNLAKHIAMRINTERGHQVREYFIAAEKLAWELLKVGGKEVVSKANPDTVKSFAERARALAQDDALPAGMFQELYDLQTKQLSVVTQELVSTNNKLRLVVNNLEKAEAQVRQLGTDLDTVSKESARRLSVIEDLKGQDYKTAHIWKRCIPQFRNLSEHALGQELSLSARMLGEAMPPMPVKGHPYKSVRTYNKRTVVHYLLRLREIMKYDMPE